MPYNRAGAMKLLHVLGSRHGYDHAALRELAASLFQLDPATASISKLTDAQLHNFIQHLQGNRPGDLPQVKNSASPKQLFKIRELATEIGMDENPARLEGFIARQARGKRNLNELTIWEASHVIEGLKSLTTNADAAK